MTKLAFAIAQYNRPQQLERCIESIAGQVRPDDDVKVIVLDDGSDAPEVPEVCARMAEKYQCVEIRRREENGGDYAPAFQHLFRAAPDAEWVWTFGNDDVLQPKALAFFLSDVLPRMEKRDFMHISETTRASGTNMIVGADRLIDLCCTFGWIEMTGFITGNVCRGSLLAAAAETPRWKKYAASAFVQSAALLEAAWNRPCAFVDIPLIATQDNSYSEDTLAMWGRQNITTRYLYAADCIELMFDDGILKDKVPAKFFRYLNIHLWDRFIVNNINDYGAAGKMWPEWAWDKIARLADFVLEDEIAEDVRKDVEFARGAIRLGLFLDHHAASIKAAMGEIGERRCKPAYAYTFIEPAADKPVVVPAS